MSSTSSIDAIFEAAVADRVIPGVIVAASTTDGKLSYVKSFGVRSLKPPESQHSSAGEEEYSGCKGAVPDLEPLEKDAILWMGSCTKIMTAIAALQCVERGLFGLDEDVTGILPELKDIQVQVPGEKREQLVLVKSKGVITLRRLLNHTSGLSYTKFGQLDLPLIDRCLVPLVFEPGEGFIYGTGTDFAGLMVERATSLSLESYINQNIALPIGIPPICFHPAHHDSLSHHHPPFLPRLPAVSIRDKTTTRGTLSHTDQTIWPLDLLPLHETSGGSGAYCTIPGFQRILHSLTANDGRLLSSGMVDELFGPDLSEKVRRGVMEALRNDTTRNIYGGLPRGLEASYAMGGMVVLEDYDVVGEDEDGGKRRRPRGSMHWGALLNIFFWMDRTNGVSGIFGSQVFPAGDVDCLRLFGEFEEAVYGMVYGKREAGEDL